MRELRLTEEFGMYRVRTDGIDVTAGSVDGVLTKAMTASPAFSDPLPHQFFPFESAEVLDSLLGRKEGS